MNVQDASSRSQARRSCAIIPVSSFIGMRSLSKLREAKALSRLTAASNVDYFVATRDRYGLLCLTEGGLRIPYASAMKVEVWGLGICAPFLQGHTIPAWQLFRARGGGPGLVDRLLLRARARGLEAHDPDPHGTPLTCSLPASKRAIFGVLIHALRDARVQEVRDCSHATEACWTITTLHRNSESL